MHIFLQRVSMVFIIFFKKIYLKRYISKKDITVLIPECDLIWRYSFYRGNQIKMKSLEWVIIQYNWCPYKKKTAKEKGLEQILPSQPQEGSNPAYPLISDFRPLEL